MAPAGLLLSAVFGLLASASFALIGARLGRRRPEGGFRLAHRAFRLWWWAASGYAFLVGFLLNSLAIVGWTPLPFFIAVRQFSILILAVGVYGLLHYVSFLWTGWSRGGIVWAIVAAALYFAVTIVFASAVATGVHVGPYDTRLDLSPAPDPNLAGLAIGALTVPELLAAVALLALAPRLEPAARRRALLVGASLIAWFGASAMAAARVDDPIILARPVLGMVAALCVLLAYAPPRALEAWAAGASDRRTAMASRMQQLI